MTLRHLRIFTMVYRLGSMSAAAEKLHLSQPAVSTAIREMETYYGVRLFDRLARRLYRTPQERKCTDMPCTSCRYSMKWSRP